jgi:hypothetical protein
MPRLPAAELAAMAEKEDIPSVNETQWAVMPRTQHPAVSTVLDWVHKNQYEPYCNDYHAITLLASCRPVDDLIRLCQCLRMDGAGQGLSDKKVTCTNFRWNGETLDLFWELLEHLRSRAGIQSLYDACGKVNPDGEYRREAKRVFRKFQRDFTSRQAKFGHIPTAKYFLRASSDEALYVLLFQPDTYATLVQTGSAFEHKPYHDPYSSIWARILAHDPQALDTWY